MNKSKGGWKRMYKDYTTAMEECINGKIDLKIWNMLVNSTKADFSLSINITNLSNTDSTSNVVIINSSYKRKFQCLYLQIQSSKFLLLEAMIAYQDHIQS